MSVRSCGRGAQRRHAPNAPNVLSARQCSASCADRSSSRCPRPTAGSPRRARRRFRSSARSGITSRRVARACLHATTGAGKTYAVWFGLLGRLLAEARTQAGALRLLWITPMRALVADTVRALRAPLEALGLRLGGRGAHRRHRCRRARAPVAAPARGARHHAREPVAAADARRRARTVRAARDGRGRRVARAARQQARRAGAARAGAPAALAPTAPARCGALSATLGNLEHAQDVLLGPGRDGVHRARAHRQDAASPTPCCPTIPAASPGAGTSASRWWNRWCARSPRTPRRSSSPTRARRPSSGTRRCSGEAGLGRAAGAASRLARPRSARLGRARPQGGPSQGGGRDLEPRPRRRLPAGGARAADRQRQGRRAAAAARRPQRPRAGPRLARDARADPRARADRGAAAGRKAVVAALADGRVEARAAPRKPLDVLVQHLVTIALGERLLRGRAAGGGARHGELRRADGRGVALGARLRGARRRVAARLPGLPAHRARRRRALHACRMRRSRAATACRSARSCPMRRWSCATPTARPSAASRRASSRACGAATASSSPASCSSWCGCTR